MTWRVSLDTQGLGKRKGALLTLCGERVGEREKTAALVHWRHSISDDRLMNNGGGLDVGGDYDGMLS